MFQTFDSNKVDTPLFRQGEHGWDLVSFVLNQPWFFVTIEVTKLNGEVFDRNIMLKHTHQLAEYMQYEEISYKCVNVVTPGYINGSGNWKMEALQEIWLQKPEAHKNSNTFDCEYVFVLENGEKYICMAPPDENFNVPNQLIFSWKGNVPLLIC